MSEGVPPALVALHNTIHSTDDPDRPHMNEVTDDIEAEGETIPDYVEEDEDTDAPSTFDISKLQDFLLEASKGVTEDTDLQYKRLMQRCLKFWKENKLIKETDKFFTTAPNALVPLCICAWIMSE
ncbi:hypothetical protein C8F04DRAFT_1264576 [Mycena alexandri]|uniref:Uncharacterized protein n=1 Tax=Mycena alexandri TaxID=1745969 RepID=A0AAD6SNW5_9AGAR|nr:hypothetical protein C8F04DRAFT_1264576 [Mycena alexandri]